MSSGCDTVKSNMSSGIFSYFGFPFNFFNLFRHYKESKQSPQETDIERNVINEEQKDEQRVETKDPHQISYIRAVLMVALFAYLHFVAFVDQYIFVAILPVIKQDYHVVGYTSQFITLGYLGTRVTLSPFISCATSRCDRKMVTCIGLFFYTLLSLGCTFIPQQGFWLFMLTRLFLASMAESCLSTVPLVIADLFCPDQRTRVLGFYTCTKSVCCMLACLFGTPVVELASLHWHYALWTTPGLGLLGLVLAIIIMKDPQPEGMDEVENDSEDTELRYSCFSDLKQLLSNCSFLTYTAGALCYVFVYGAKNSWAHKLVKKTRQELLIETQCLTTGCNYDDK
ncbi:protein spinster homolog 1-like [Xenopus laevis]|uniref:Protein spinster homolog 1-like n=1 Tax=Xenopus laevis TaxID=8355 RepID=A0A8J1MKF6_XENLA|nr:protein spinster homolog 1-like [Xenopus laevis]